MPPKLAKPIILAPGSASFVGLPGGCVRIDELRNIGEKRDQALSMDTLDLSAYGLSVREVWRNAAVSLLYEHAVTLDGEQITASGALAASSGEKTGRSPRDKRIVEHRDSEGDIWWGPVNIKLPEPSFVRLRQQAVAFLNTRDRLYVVDGYAGWDPKCRVKIRVLCARPYHALFMHAMLMRFPAARNWPILASPTT